MTTKPKAAAAAYTAAQRNGKGVTFATARSLACKRDSSAAHEA